MVIITIITRPDMIALMIPETDVVVVETDDDAEVAQPKPKQKTNAGKKPSLRPVAKNSQHTKKLPDVETDKGSSTQKSNQIRKFLLCAVAALTSII